jgi:putative membrane protein
MSLTEYLATQNAVFNGGSAVLILLGYRAIKGGARDTHKKFMLGALTLSALFLAGYLTRVILYPSKPFAGVGVWKVIYLTILLSHMVLAAVVPPLALYSVYLALKGNFARHKVFARYAFPIWLYVSITGVLVYLLLFQLFPG